MSTLPLPLFSFLIFLCAILAPKSYAVPGTQTDFECQFKEDQTDILAKFTILNLNDDPALRGEAEDDDHITSNRVTNAPIFFQYKLPSTKWITPVNPIEAISAGAFNESVDLNLINENEKQYLSMTTADTDNCLTLELKLEQAGGYKTGTYKMVSCGDGAKKLMPVTCKVGAPIAADIPAPDHE